MGTLLPQGVDSWTVNANWLHLDIGEWSINSSASQNQVEGAANSLLSWFICMMNTHLSRCLSDAVYSFP